MSYDLLTGLQLKPVIFALHKSEVEERKHEWHKLVDVENGAQT